MPLNKSRHRTCDHNLKITNLQPFDSGCTLVQWSDKSSCFSNDPAVNYTLEVLRSCSDQTSPLFIMELTNSTSTDHKTIAFNASMYNIAKPFHLRVKAESEEFWWKSRCYAIHRDLRVNTTCMLWYI